VLLAGYPAQATKMSPPAQTKEQRQRQLDDLRERVQAVQRELAASEETRGEAADALRQSEKAISTANRHLFELAAQQKDVQKQVAALAAEAQTLQQSIATQRSALERLLLQQYLGGRHEPLKLILSGQDPQSITRLLYYYRIIARERAEMLRSLQAALDRNRELASASETKQHELQTIETAAQQERSALVRERRQRQSVLDQLARQTRDKKRKLAALQADERRLGKLVEKLARIVQASPATTRGGPADRAAETSPGPTTDAASFFALKGKLPFPAHGELGNRFGSPRTDGGALWKGLFIRCTSGEQVRAVAAGRVVFADWLRGFGNLLIIDHGAGYMSLYGNNDALLHEVGAAVSAGDAVAQAGSSGGNPDSGVYFELRYQGKAFDPLPWIAK
jgi:septal ring factor EnvC (AmiA/AmiB activator)